MRKLTRAAVNARNFPVKVIQFGDGNFLRGFADWMIDILNEQTAFSGSVVVVAPLRRGRPEQPDEQEGLYHVVLRGVSEGKHVDDVRLVTCIEKKVDPYQEYDSFLATADQPTLQFVISNTTEAGISFNDQDNQCNTPPNSFPAKVTQLLYRRFQTFRGDRSKGLIFLPCELIENNGHVLKETVLQYVAHWTLPEEFGSWITEACIFCNTLVDRIVTGYPQGYAQEIMKRTGFEDKRLVAAEPYHLWVIEAEESMNRYFPVSSTSLNVKFVRDLMPYRTCKVRILNGAHTAMTLIGYLRDLRTVKEAVGDAWMSRFLQEMLTEEVIPTIPLPAEEVKEYVHQVFERFHNPEIRHELKSIALNSVSKFRTRLLPTLLDHYHAWGKLPLRLMDVFAALIVFYKGTWHGEPLPVNDSPDVMNAMAKCWSGENPPQLNALLSDEAIWGHDLTSIPGFGDALRGAVVQIVKG